MVRHAETGEPGIYRLSLPTPPGATAYALVEPTEKDPDPAPLDPLEAETLSRNWPLTFLPEPIALADRLLAIDKARRSELWQILILGALGALCLEVYLTRRMARRQGLA